MIQKDDKRQIWSWAMYDFANSAFTTLIVTFIYGTFFTKSIADNEILGTQYWSLAISFTAIVVALFSPILGAIADNLGARKRIMLVSTLVCVTATALLFFPQQGQVLLALTLFIIANIAFEIGTVFCNAYLAELSSEERIAFIRSMVDGLAQRLRDNPGDLAGWKRLARAYQVLGDTKNAHAAESRIRELEHGAP